MLSRIPTASPSDRHLAKTVSAWTFFQWDIYVVA